MKLQLLCTFTYMDQLTNCLGNIYRTHTPESITNLKCYMYVDDPNNIICVYNIDGSVKRMKDTISINRKKESNTYYSINALNSLIRGLNNGLLDKQFRVDWSNYQDMLILSDNEYNCKIIKIRELSH